MSDSGSPFGYDSQMGPPKDLMDDIIRQRMSESMGDTSQTAGRYYLPGVGLTFLDPGFHDKVTDFIQRAQSRGAKLAFKSGYRTQEYQNTLPSDPTATTPAEHSLHSAGRAVDIHLPTLPNGGGVDRIALHQLVGDATAAGLKWGGYFQHPKPDEGHFYFDPGGNREVLINRFTQAINKRNGAVQGQ